MTVLSVERNQSGGGEAEHVSSVQRLIRRAAEARREGAVALDSAAVRARLAHWWVEEQGLQNFGKRVQAQMARGEGPPPTLALMKLTPASKLQHPSAFDMYEDEYAGLFPEPAEMEADDVDYQYLWASPLR